jgi:hypothetical protein
MMKVGEEYVLEMFVNIQFENITPSLLFKRPKSSAYRIILHLFYAFEKCIFTLMEEHKLQVLERILGKYLELYIEG